MRLTFEGNVAKSVTVDGVIPVYVADLDG